MTELLMYRGYIFDLDGTLYLDQSLLPGARETIEYLLGAGKRVAYLTNKPLETRAEYAAKLTSLGIPAEQDQIVNSSYVMAEYLAREKPGCRVYVIGEPPLWEEIRAAGIEVIADPAAVDYELDYVVAAFDRTFHYDKLNHALQAIKKGAGFVATNPDRTCPVVGGEIPDCAAMIGAIEGTTGKNVQMIVGKPNKLMIETALGVLGTHKNETIIIGDRLETDIAMGAVAGIASAVVLTGITQPEDVSSDTLQYRPDYVLQGVKDILEAARKDGCE